MSQPQPLVALLLSALAAAGCADKGVYDLDAWQSPLASGFSGTPDAAEGERLYVEEHWNDDTPYAFTCAGCHGKYRDRAADGTYTFKPGN